MMNIQDLEKEMVNILKLEKLEELRHVLFDEKNQLPHAVHLFLKDGKFFTNSHDERGYIVGKSFEFDNFEEAKKDFIEKLKLTVEINRGNVKVGYSADYSSPLWDTEN